MLSVFLDVPAEKRFRRFSSHVIGFCSSQNHVIHFYLAINNSGFSSLARLKLLKKLEIIHAYSKPDKDDPVKSNGCFLLYCDTDSILFMAKKSLKKKIFEALDVRDDMLGFLKEEYEDYIIEEYVSGGAKQYVLKVRHLLKQELLAPTQNHRRDQL